VASVITSDAPQTLHGPRDSALASRERPGNHNRRRWWAVKRNFGSWRSFWIKSVHGSGKFVLLSGEPGIGKTALARTFLYAAERHHPGFIGRPRRVRRAVWDRRSLSAVSCGNCRDSWQAKPANTWSVAAASRTNLVLAVSIYISGSALEQLEHDAIGANKDRMLRELGDALEEIVTVFRGVCFSKTSIGPTHPASI